MMLDLLRRRLSSWLRRRTRRRYGILPSPMMISSVVRLPDAQLVDGVWVTR